VVLGREPGERVGAQDDLFDLGLTSVGVLEMHSRLAAAAGVDLPVDLLYDLPTAALLAERIAEELEGGTPVPPG